MANRRTQKSRNQKANEDSEFDSQNLSLSQESPPSSNAQAEQHQRRYAFDCYPYRFMQHCFERMSLLIAYFRLREALAGKLEYEVLNFVSCVRTTNIWHSIGEERKGRKREESQEGEKRSASNCKASQS